MAVQLPAHQEQLQAAHAAGAKMVIDKINNEANRTAELNATAGLNLDKGYEIGHNDGYGKGVQDGSIATTAAHNILSDAAGSVGLGGGQLNQPAPDMPEDPAEQMAIAITQASQGDQKAQEYLDTVTQAANAGDEHAIQLLRAGGDIVNKHLAEQADIPVTAENIAGAMEAARGGDENASKWLDQAYATPEGQAIRAQMAGLHK